MNADLGLKKPIPYRGWARLLIDRMDTQVQRPEFPQAPEPAWGSTNASAQDDKAMNAHHYHHPPSGFAR